MSLPSSNSNPARSVGSAPEFFGMLAAKEAEIRGRRREINVERVADSQEQAAILARNENEALCCARDRNLLIEVRAAMVRLQRGEFGFCLSCERPIGDKWLVALPWASKCVRCADAQERVAREQLEPCGRLLEETI